MTAKLRLREGIQVRTVGEELLIHDARTGAVHHLDRDAATVWSAVEAGATLDALPTLTGLSGERSHAALAALIDVGLVIADAGSLSRRRLMQRAALVSGGAVVTTLVLPMAWAAASGATGTLPGPGQAVDVANGGFFYSAIPGTHNYSVQVIGGGGGAGSGNPQNLAGPGGDGGSAAVVVATMTITYPATVFLSAGTAGGSPADASTGSGGSGGTTTGTNGTASTTGGDGGSFAVTDGYFGLMYPGAGGGGYSFISGGGQTLVAGGGGGGGGSGYSGTFNINSGITRTAIGPIAGGDGGTTQDGHSAGQAGDAGQNSGAGGGGGGSTGGEGGSYSPRTQSGGGSSGLYATESGLVLFGTPSFSTAQNNDPGSPSHIYGQRGVPDGDSATGGYVLVVYDS